VRTPLRQNMMSKDAKNCTIWRRSLPFSVNLWWMNTSIFWYKHPLVCSIHAFLT
jgi:hypothetical protein